MKEGENIDPFEMAKKKVEEGQSFINSEHWESAESSYLDAVKKFKEALKNRLTIVEKDCDEESEDELANEIKNYLKNIYEQLCEIYKKIGSVEKEEEAFWQVFLLYEDLYSSISEGRKYVKDNYFQFMCDAEKKYKILENSEENNKKLAKIYHLLGNYYLEQRDEEKNKSAQTLQSEKEKAIFYFTEAESKYKKFDKYTQSVCLNRLYFLKKDEASSEEKAKFLVDYAEFLYQCQLDDVKIFADGTTAAGCFVKAGEAYKALYLWDKAEEMFLKASASVNQFDINSVIKIYKALCDLYILGTVEANFCQAVINFINTPNRELLGKIIHTLAHSIDIDKLRRFFLLFAKMLETVYEEMIRVNLQKKLQELKESWTLQDIIENGWTLQVATTQKIKYLENKVKEFEAEIKLLRAQRSEENKTGVKRKREEIEGAETTEKTGEIEEGQGVKPDASIGPFAGSPLAFLPARSVSSGSSGESSASKDAPNSSKRPKLGSSMDGVD